MRKTEAKSKRIESTSTETTPFVAVETAEVTGEEHPDRGTVNDGADNVETAKEAGGRHRGRVALRTVSSCSTTILSNTTRTTAWTKIIKSSGIKRN